MLKEKDTVIRRAIVILDAVIIIVIFVLAYIFSFISASWQIWFLPLFIILVYSISFFSLLLLGCFDNYEIDALESIINHLPIRVHNQFLNLSKPKVKFWKSLVSIDVFKYHFDLKSCYVSDALRIFRTCIRFDFL